MTNGQRKDSYHAAKMTQGLAECKMGVRLGQVSRLVWRRAQRLSTATVVVLGGYGNAGRAIADGLLWETQARVVVAGRNLARAQEVAKALSEEHAEERIGALQVDAANPNALVKALKGAALVVVASSTAPYTRNVVAAALAAGCDYLDIQASKAKLKVLRSLAKKIKASGRCFITEAGFHPGLPSALVRFVGGRMTGLTEANVAGVMRLDWRSLQFSDSTAAEFVEVVRESRAGILRKGKWRRGYLSRGTGIRTFQFGAPFGPRRCTALHLEEMRALPQLFPSLREMGFFIAGFNWVVDKCVMPLGWLSLKICPCFTRGFLRRLFPWALAKFSRPPFGTMVKVEAKGQLDGKPSALTLVLHHEDAYVFTAVPVVACILQYVDGDIRRPGLWTMGNLVEPERFMADMARMGLPHRIETQHNNPVR